MAVDQSLVPIKNSYGNVLQVANANIGVDATLRPVCDLKGGVSALSLSETEAHITSLLTTSTSTAIETIDAAETLDLTHGTVLADVSGGTFITTLPTAASAFNATLKIGRIYTWMKGDTGGNTASLKAAGSELINTVNQIDTVTPFNAYKIQSTGTGWVQI